MQRIGFFGPRGTFTEQALLAMPIATDADLVDYKTVSATLDAVRRGEVDSALVPFENSVEGSVSATLDELAYGEPLIIVDEVALAVEFALMVRPGTQISDITLYTTHPHAYAQRREWLETALPDAHFSPALSNAAAAVEVSDPSSRFQAAIGPRIAAEHYGLDIIADDIGDNEAAHTRFVLVSKRRKPQPPTGADCTTLVIFIRQDHHPERVTHDSQTAADHLPERRRVSAWPLVKLHSGRGHGLRFRDDLPGKRSQNHSRRGRPL